MTLIPSKYQVKNPKIAKWGVVGAVIAILILTVLEFPAPIGFETRPQNNVLILFGMLFLVILVSEITAASLVFKKTNLAIKFAIVAGILNIIQIIADIMHLMQPEVAPFGYTILELSVGLLSLMLIYFALSLKGLKK